MNAQTISPDAKIIEVAHERTDWPKLWWNGIFGGAIAAVGIHVILSVLGVGAGLATFSPVADSDSVTHFKIGAAIGWSACAVFSLFIGATLAGRFYHSTHTGLVRGIVVWSLTFMVTLLLLSRGAEPALGGGVKVLSAGFDTGTEALVSNGGDVDRDGFQRSH